jgi:hypothetical protein
MSLFDDPPVRDFPDHAIRELLKDRRNLEELLQAALPGQAPELDVPRAELLDRDFVLEDWRERSSDLFWKIPLRQPHAGLHSLVCLLLEHQTAADPVMPLRMLLYAAWYWEREWKRWETAHTRGRPLQLPPVIPLVFHTGAVPWHTNRNLGDLIAATPLFQGFAPNWPIHFFDLAERTPQELLNAAPLLEAFAVVRAEHEEPAAFRDVLVEVMRRLAALQGQERVRWSDLMWFVLSWAVRRRPDEERDQLRAVIEANVPDRPLQQEIVAMSQQTRKTFEEWAFEQGELRGLRKLLKSMLERRFQNLPPELVQRIEQVDSFEQLGACIQLANSINSLEELQL